MKTVLENIGIELRNREYKELVKILSFDGKHYKYQYNQKELLAPLSVRSSKILLFPKLQKIESQSQRNILVSIYT